MTVQLACPECDARLVVADDVLGKRIRCKKCGSVFAATGGDEPRRERARSGGRGGPEDATGGGGDRRRRPREHDADAEPRSGPRPARGGPKRKHRPKRSMGALVSLVIVGAILSLAGAAVGVAYLLGAFESTDNKSPSVAGGTQGTAGKAKQPPAGAAAEPVVEELTIEQVQLNGEDAANAFSIKYRWKGGAALPGEYFVVVGAPGGQERSIPFEHNNLVEGFEIFEQTSRGRKDFDVWIAKRSGRAGSKPVRVSNVIHIDIRA